jgi:hypothetical protein
VAYLALFVVLPAVSFLIHLPDDAGERSIMWAVLLLLPLIDRWRAAAPLPAVILDVAHAVACVLRLEEDGPCAMVGGDARRVILCGNSSGGHLLSLVTLDGRWLGSLGAPTERIRACIDMSGVHSFAMLPLPMRCAFAALLGLDLPQWASLSPMHHASAPSLGVGCPFLLATAARELPGRTRRRVCGGGAVGVVARKPRRPPARPCDPAHRPRPGDDRGAAGVRSRSRRGKAQERCSAREGHSAAKPVVIARAQHDPAWPLRRFDWAQRGGGGGGGAAPKRTTH